MSFDFDFMMSLGAMYIGNRFYTSSEGYETGAFHTIAVLAGYKITLVSTEWGPFSPTSHKRACKMLLTLQRLLKAVFQFGQASIS